MRVRTSKAVDVDDDVAVHIAREFMESLERQGYELTHANEGAFKKSYEELAQLWVDSAGEI